MAVSEFARLAGRTVAAVTLSAILCLMLSCSRAGLKAPMILFSNVPPAGEGGPNKVAEISGQVRTARAEDRLVIYAKSDVWWVQPTMSRPYTAIDPDGRWSASTHLGSEYAALLVDGTFHPVPVMRGLPSPGSAGVRAINTVKGQTITPENSKARPAMPVTFSGYQWMARSIAGDRGGIMREYDPANVAVDSAGALHMKVIRRNDRWVCSEVELTRSLGYGTYLFEVKDVAGLEPAADLEMFTWSSLAVSQEHSEMDINLSRRGDPASKNAEFIVQPYYIAPNVYRYNAPAGLLTYSFDWEPDAVSFVTSSGSAGPGRRKPVANHVFTTSIPQHTEETAHINFCAYGYSKVPMQHDAEVVIEKFQYLP